MQSKESSGICEDYPRKPNLVYNVSTLTSPEPASRHLSWGFPNSQLSVGATAYDELMIGADRDSLHAVVEVFFMCVEGQDFQTGI